MELHEKEKIMAGQAVLFVGAGFSYGAKNVEGIAIPVGDDLIKQMNKVSGVTSAATLQVASTCFLKKQSPQKLIDFLKRQLTVSQVASWHKEIVDLPWRRIYSVNYDNVVEAAAEENGNPIDSICLSDNIRGNQKRKVCVHLNGEIRRLNKVMLDKEFKLTGTSYAKGSLRSSPWYELMISDFEMADAIVVIGYSMQADMEILQQLAVPTVAKKVILIDSASPTEINQLTLPDYGRYYAIGVQNFAKEMADFAKEYVPSVLPETFYTFDHRYQSAAPVSSVGYEKIVEFYTIGKYEEGLLQKDFSKGPGPQYKYVLYRASLDCLMEDLSKYSYFVVTADLGNGKTMFCNLLQNELQFENYHVFLYRKRQYTWKDEVRKIAENYERAVVIIDDYPAAMDIIQEFSGYDGEQLKFVFTARTALNKGMYRTLLEKLRVESKEVRCYDINTLSRDETEQLAFVLKNNRVSPVIQVEDSCIAIEKFIKENCKSRFCDLLLEFYNSSDIKERLTALICSISDEERDLRDIMIFSLMKPVMNLPVELSDFERLLQVDHARFSKEGNFVIKELFNIQDYTPIVKSSIVAQNILYGILSIDEVLDLSSRMLKACVGGGRTHYELMRNLMSHTHYTRFSDTSENMEKVLRFYDDLRNYYKDNHFFWEQFALICITCKKYGTAYSCIRTAYQIAAKEPSFVPFQIDTIYGSCVLSELIGTLSSISPYEALQKTTDACNRIFRNIDHVDCDKYRAYKHLSKIIRIYDYYVADFDKKELQAFKGILQRIRREMERYKKSGGDASFSKELEGWIAEFTKRT